MKENGLFPLKLFMDNLKQCVPQYYTVIKYLPLWDNFESYNKVLLCGMEEVLLKIILDEKG